MNAQEIFDTVAKHLFAQGQQSISREADDKDGWTCVYRGPNGLKCAVGALISDELYVVDMEYNTVGALLTNPRFTFPTWMHGLKNGSLLRSLQRVHDEAVNWHTGKVLREALEGVAKTHDLSAAVLEGLEFNEKATCE